MSTPVMQHSFNSGEWAPALNARVDLAKYHSGAALLRNFFVDYRGGATGSPGTKYILQAFRSATAVRLIPFQASFTVSYILEFGDQYIRFFNNGAPVLEGAVVISAATNANPGVFTSVAHGYTNGQWIYASNFVGMAQVNGNYYIIAGATANTFTLTDLFGNVIDTSAFGVFAAGTVQRVYTLASPFSASELAQIKFAQNVNILILCHPNHPPQVLTLISAANWTIGAIAFGATIAAPGAPAITSSAAPASGNAVYSYIVTSVDANGQESAPSAPGGISAILDMRAVAITNKITWAAVAGVSSYNVYRAQIGISTAIPAGSPYGFIGNATGLSLLDSNISPDFSQGVPIALNPFNGTGVASVTVTAQGVYGAGAISVPAPAVSFSGGGGSGAAATSTLSAISVAINNGGNFYAVNDRITILSGAGVILQVTSVGAFGVITGVSIVNSGAVISGSGGVTPSNPTIQGTTTGSGSGGQFNFTWGVVAVSLTAAGTGYGGAPAVAFDAGAATATSAIGAPSSGNPTVPSLHQQRMLLLGPVGNPQQFNGSATGSIYNYNVHTPLEADDAFQGTLVSGQLNTIQSAISQPQGLIILSDKGAWLLNGGSPGSAISPDALVANPQAFNGASYPPPIVATSDILYVQAKTSIVRNLTFNYYTQVYTGTDISVLSSHLFYGYQIREWAWAEEPFKLVWAVRNDGIMLTLTFLKEQELIAWAHRDTNGAFKSVASVTEQVAIGSVDAVYVAAQRTVRGQVLQYIERLVELYYPVGATDAWCVDAGLQYNGVSTSTFSGAQHLAGLTVTGLATDSTGKVTVIAPFVMPVSGTFNAAQLPNPPAPATGYTRVTVGLAYTPQLTTLQLDTGEPTIQGKEKKISSVILRVAKTLGLQICTGTDFTAGTLVDIPDLVVGNVGTATNAVVTDLVTGDAWSTVDPAWTVPGQYSIQQSLPYPVSILGVIPQVTIGDTAK